MLETLVKDHGKNGFAVGDNVSDNTDYKKQDLIKNQTISEAASSDILINALLRCIQIISDVF